MVIQYKMHLRKRFFFILLILFSTNLLFINRVNANNSSSELYRIAKILFTEEKYYSAKILFEESQYKDWKKFANECLRDLPDTGELWRDKSQWAQDSKITFTIDQPEDTGAYFWVYKSGKLVSKMFVNGSGSVSSFIPGRNFYSVTYGYGTNWYGEDEAFGNEGFYERLSFDEYGTDVFFIESGLSYIIEVGSENQEENNLVVYSDKVSWESINTN